ncbi:hypothetical protein Prudu_012952 [Prunus dulcis]|uniref:Uncharacterized protein n=1 Tax=Prunus dulcis TaxID=3755 RepID=A0A4Y1REM2_PRUDU|nr:hypothetical protein Prudu_012952 [Prunus dulcis]
MASTRVPLERTPGVFAHLVCDFP